MKIKVGDRVSYWPPYLATPEHGIVKSFGIIHTVFVVYNCGGDWDNYQDYTGADTDIRDLKKGWLTDK